MDYSKKLFKYTKDFFKDFLDDKRINAIFLGGSGSRNIADKYSDIEVFIIWDVETTKETRTSIFNNTNYEILVDEEFESPAEWTTSLLIDDIKFDIYHWEEPLIDYFYEEIYTKLSASSSVQCSISSMLDAKTIKGEEYINFLKAKFSNYPKELAEKIIKKKSFYESWGVRYVLLEREDFLALENMMNGYLIQALKVLFALNKVYLRSTNFKWLDYQESLLLYKPDNLANRIRFISTNANREGLEELEKLLNKTFNLISQKAPGLDLSKEKEVFFYLRK